MTQLILKTRVACSETKKTLLKIWLNPGLNLTIFQGTQPWCIPLCFGVFSLFQQIFRRNCINNLTQDDNKDKVDDKVGHCDLTGSWTSRNKNAVFCWNSNPLQIFSSPAQEGNILFLSARFNSSHLHQTSRPLWLSSSTFLMPLCLPTNLHLKFIGHLARVIIHTDTIGAKVRWWVKQQLL